MNHSLSSPPSNKDVLNRDRPHPEDAPEFGVLDIVEAFTAMRHEWRGQTKESRALAEQIQAAVESIGAFESKVLATRDDAQRRTDDSSAASRLVKLLADTDHQLSRAVDAATQWGAAQRKLDDAEDGGVQRHVAEMGRLARWLARHLLAYLAEQRAARAAVDMNPTLEGLNLIAARLRREMNEQGIQRIDTLGKPFDADTMCAIGVATTSDLPPGHVAEQLSPAYLWNGQVVRFAEVRVAE